MLDLLMNGFQMLVNRNAICTGNMRQIWQLVGTIVWWIQIAIPVIIILLGTIDLGKAVISGDEKKVAEARGTFIKRLIYGVVVFFVIFLVQLVFSAVADANPENNACFKCVAKKGKNC